MVCYIKSAVLTGIHSLENDLLKVAEVFVFQHAGKLPRIPELLTVFVYVLDVLEGGLTVFFNIRHGVNSFRLCGMIYNLSRLPRRGAFVQIDSAAGVMRRGSARRCWQIAQVERGKGV